MDRLQAMRSFVQVLDSGSFTRAAVVLQRHKASLSEQVAQLEKALGVRLLTRTTRSVVPTAEGLAYYHQAQAILAAVDEAEAALRHDARELSGALRIEVPVALGRLVMVPEIGSFLARHPGISVDMGCTDRVSDLVKEGIDCAVRGGTLADSSMVSRSIGDVAFVLCAAPRYLAARGTPKTPRDLLRHEAVGYRNSARGAPHPIVLGRGRRRLEVPVPTRLVVDDSASVLGAGLEGLGLVQVTQLVAQLPLASGALVQVLPDWRGPTMPLSLVSPSARFRAARVQTFMDWAHGLLTRRIARLT